jgi:hypothetical protein
MQQKGLRRPKAYVGLRPKGVYARRREGRSDVTCRAEQRHAEQRAGQARGKKKRKKVKERKRKAKGTQKARRLWWKHTDIAHIYELPMYAQAASRVCNTYYIYIYICIYIYIHI